MNKIKLNQKQISELIINKKVALTENSSIEIYENEIIYNKNGKIRYATKMELEFGEIEQSDSFLQEIISEHFNIDKNQVITISSEPEDSEFKIRFTTNKEITIIVCPVNIAIKNTKILEENHNLKIDKMCTQIGLYRKLGNSAYFFRIESD